MQTGLVLPLLVTTLLLRENVEHRQNGDEGRETRAKTGDSSPGGIIEVRPKRTPIQILAPDNTLEH